MSIAEEMRGAGNRQGHTQSGPGIPERDATYYLQEDPMAIFLVENRLFKVHRHFFVEGSTVFRDMFASPNEEGVAPDGTCDRLPIPLPGVIVKEFEALLDYFHLPPHRQSQSKDEKKHLQTCLSLLSISHRFSFDDAFQYALGSMKPIIHHIPVIQRLQLGDKYELKEWLLSAYESLLDRTTPLSVDEAEVLGFKRVVRYIAARESMHRKSYFKNGNEPVGPLFGRSPDVRPEAVSRYRCLSGVPIDSKTKRDHIAAPVVPEIESVVKEFFFNPLT